MKTSKVYQFTNRNGNAVANHFVIETDKGTVFKSYNSNIVFTPRGGGKIELGPHWRYSSATSRHRSHYLGESTAETQAKLDSGEYVLNEDL